MSGSFQQILVPSNGARLRQHDACGTTILKIPEAIPFLEVGAGLRQQLDGADQCSPHRRKGDLAEAGMLQRGDYSAVLSEHVHLAMVDCYGVHRVVLPGHVDLLQHLARATGEVKSMVVLGSQAENRHRAAFQEGRRCCSQQFREGELGALDPQSGCFLQARENDDPAVRAADKNPRLLRTGNRTSFRFQLAGKEVVHRPELADRKQHLVHVNAVNVDKLLNVLLSGGGAHFPTCMLGQPSQTTSQRVCWYHTAGCRGIQSLQKCPHRVRDDLYEGFARLSVQDAPGTSERLHHGHGASFNFRSFKLTCFL
mmetsp:Transcript_65271/g.155806  ORF Transcript_65271/g.155806 Transcript_65271/m.155806 type:complete len:311 (-) Transcript_65271:64-996(-)